MNIDQMRVLASEIRVVENVRDLLDTTIFGHPAEEGGPVQSERVLCDMMDVLA